MVLNLPSQQIFAGWAAGRGERAGPGPAAMNLERLRKRVRQYLDQVGSAGDAGGAVETRSWRRAAMRPWALVRAGALEIGRAHV